MMTSRTVRLPRVTRVARAAGLLLLAVTAVALLTGRPARPAGAQDNTVVFAGWGGTLQASQREAYFKPFEKATGIRVIDVPDVNMAKIQSMVETKNVEWDVVQALGMWIPQGEPLGLWERLDYGAIDKAGYRSYMTLLSGIGIQTAGIILAYNTKAFPAGKEPKSWADYWNLTGFPGRRGMLNAPRYSLEFALMADGVPKDKLYPLDVDRAFRSLDKIKSQINVWWTQWPQPPLLLTSGEIVMSPTSNGRIIPIQKEAPVEIQWNQGLLTVDYLAIPKGTRRRENAQKLVAWMSKPEPQAEFSRQSGYGPSNEQAMKLLDEETRKKLPTNYLDKLAVLDNAWWAENITKVTDRWNEWRLK
jgi:putative spermidine/putrescine transport system substrate-binding protein